MAIVLLALVVLAGHRAEAAFDFARYKEASLDDLLALPRPRTGVDVKRAAPFKLEVTLSDVGGVCPSEFLKRSMLISGFTKEQVDALGVSHCIKVRSAKGRELKVFVQDIVYGFLPREVPVGGKLTLYAIHVFTSAEGPGLLVNEFQTAQSAEQPKPPSSPSETAMARCGCWTQSDHPGVDLEGDVVGAPVGVIEDGVVVKIEQNEQAPADLPIIGGCGRYVVLKHSYPNGAVVFTRYVGLGRLIDSKGQVPGVGTRIKKGEKIGELGANKMFHFELRPVAQGNVTADAAWARQYGGIADMEWSRYEPVDPKKFDPDAFGGQGTRGK
ncbi:M23 family metallopeptidase [Bradyrhizobium sp. HKCCYLS2038]|uniref:M23 family metallopeptidase n=1 Tax=unclassified Bradyrhizobium TaxID=2631580 RepID=UPI003EBA3FFC